MTTPGLGIGVGELDFLQREQRNCVLMGVLQAVGNQILF